jgi:hypothetical protein
VRTVCIINPDNLSSLRLAEMLGYKVFDNCTYKGRACAMLERAAS